MATLRSALRSFLVVLLVLFLASQVVRPDRTNPPTDPTKALTAHVPVPPNVASILDRSCRDCHSHQTTWRWYSAVAPASWLIAHDVEEGREHLNFSTWAELSRHDQREALEEVCEEVRKGGMPVKAYLVMHPGARLTAADVETLCAWADASRASLARR